MNFKSKTEKQLSEENLIAKGVYPFEVINAKEKRSKAGNEMIELELRIFTNDGRERSLRDWLMPTLGFKLFHFCSYVGLGQAYANETLTSADCIGKSGYAEIVIQPDKAGQYPDRNSVKDYVRPDMKASPARPALTQAQQNNVATDKVESEDVPF